MSSFPPKGGSDSQASSSRFGPIALGCSQFEAAWRRVDQGDAQPQIEDYLGTTEDPERTLLLLELIRLDQQYRRQLGVALTDRDYAARFPALDPTRLDRALNAANPPPPAPPTDTVDFQPSGASADPSPHSPTTRGRLPRMRQRISPRPCRMRRCSTRRRARLGVLRRTPWSRVTRSSASWDAVAWGSCTRLARLASIVWSRSR